jgi:hypothetical protein
MTEAAFVFDGKATPITGRTVELIALLIASQDEVNDPRVQKIELHLGSNQAEVKCVRSIVRRKWSSE